MRVSTIFEILVVRSYHFFGPEPELNENHWNREQDSLSSLAVI